MQSNAPFLGDKQPELLQLYERSNKGGRQALMLRGPTTFVLEAWRCGASPAELQIQLLSVDGWMNAPLSCHVFAARAGELW